MKKMLVLALALVAFVGQDPARAAGPEGKDKARAAKEAIARRAREHAARANHVNPAVKDVSDKIANSRLGAQLNGNQSHDLETALNDALLLKTAREIVASHTANPKLDALNRARLEGLANIGKLSPQVRNLDAELALPEQKAEQAYTALVLSAGKQAANWPEATQKNMIQFLEIANDAIRSGKSVGQAMEFAKSELKRLAKVDIKIEDIRKLCKLA
jgi:hypothetical protein